MKNAEIDISRLPERTEPAPNHTVLTGIEFLKDFDMEAQRAEKRVWGQAMAIYPSQPFFLDTIRAANTRGLDARLNVDWFTLLVSEGGINALIGLKKIIGKGNHHELLRDYNKQAYRSLIDRGVAVRFTNPPTLREKVFPYTGRNHIKIYIVDNVGYIGGINIQDDSIKGIDFAVKFTDPKVVDALVWQFENGESERRDYRIDLPNGDRLIVDGGTKGQSLILKNAVDLVNDARSSVRNISFFTPDGPFVKSLSDADKRGVYVEVVKPEGQWKILNPSAWVDINNRLQIAATRKSVPFEKTAQRLHAKLLIVDDEIAIIGSHNLMASGVKAGTQELVYMTRNPQVVRLLTDFYKKIKSGALTQAD